MPFAIRSVDAHSFTPRSKACNACCSHASAALTGLIGRRLAIRPRNSLLSAMPSCTSRTTYEEFSSVSCLPDGVVMSRSGTWMSHGLGVILPVTGT
ncbi:MAG: hypothetical protein M0P59_09470 [Gallionella sp.]|nr:hypothetical protein [Gallionella sp.]MCK9354374.1 hypothetical protein [Gallionella sp.]